MSIIDQAFALIRPRGRMVGFVIPDVTMRETHTDNLIVTDHPVETGATISDHAFKRPVEVEMLLGWSNCSGQSPGYIDMVYAGLQALQGARQPFDVLTGKRAYRNMIFAGLSVTTDGHSEETLMVNARLKEVIIVSTQTTGAPASSQASPESTGSTEGQGQKSAFGFADPRARA